MKRHSKPFCIPSAVLAFALACTMVPSSALAAEAETSAPSGVEEAATAEVEAEAPALNEAQDAETATGAEAPAQDDASTSASADQLKVQASLQSNAPDLEMISGVVDLTQSIPSTLINFNGLTFQVNDDGADTVTLIGWTGKAPEGSLVIPEAIRVSDTAYHVTRIEANETMLSGIARAAAEPAADEGLMAVSLPSGDTQLMTEAAWRALRADAVAAAYTAPQVTTIQIPASVTSIDPAAFAAYPHAASITVSADNPLFASHNGMLFDKDLTCLLLVPEGMEGAAVLPFSLATVPACSFSRCTKLSALDFPKGSTAAAFASVDGVLYTADMRTLIAAPVGSGASVRIADACTQIAEGAFWGMDDVQTIVAGTAISAIATGPLFQEDAAAADELCAIPAFTDAAIAQASIVLNGAEDEAARAVWQAAGFTSFAQPAQPGDRIEPVEGSGFAFELLADYTLAVSWWGSDPAPAALELPAFGTLDGVSYGVSEVAAQGFADQEEIVTVTGPDTLVRIGEGAFADCSHLRTALFGNGVSLIEADAFRGTALSSFVLPTGLRSVGARAFGGLQGTVIVDLVEAASLDETVLEGSSGVDVYVPYNDQETYAWNIGVPALGNHLYPYGIRLASDAIHLTVGQTANLFADDGYLRAPGIVEPVYSYNAKCVSIDQETGDVQMIQAGSARFEITLTMLVEETWASGVTQREVELTPAALSAAPDAERPAEVSTLNRSVAGLGAVAGIITGEDAAESSAAVVDEPADDEPASEPDLSSLSDEQQAARDVQYQILVPLYISFGGDEQSAYDVAAPPSSMLTSIEFDNNGAEPVLLSTLECMEYREGSICEVFQEMNPAGRSLDDQMLFSFWNESMGEETAADFNHTFHEGTGGVGCVDTGLLGMNYVIGGRTYDAGCDTSMVCDLRLNLTNTSEVDGANAVLNADNLIPTEDYNYFAFVTLKYTFEPFDMYLEYKDENGKNVIKLAAELKNDALELAETAVYVDEPRYESSFDTDIPTSQTIDTTRKDFFSELVSSDVGDANQPSELYQTYLRFFEESVPYECVVRVGNSWERLRIIGINHDNVFTGGSYTDNIAPRATAADSVTVRPQETNYGPTIFTGGEYAGKAGLTFQWLNCFGTRNDYTHNTELDSRGGYANSIVRNEALSESNEELWGKMPATVQSHIQEVVKSSYTVVDSTQRRTVRTKEKLFVVSLAETARMEEGDARSNFIRERDGFQYGYYALKDSSTIKSIQNADGSWTPQRWMLRSTGSVVNYNFRFVTPSGMTNQATDALTTAALVPSFCF